MDHHQLICLSLRSFTSKHLYFHPKSAKHTASTAASKISYLIIWLWPLCFHWFQMTNLIVLLHLRQMKTVCLIIFLIKQILEDVEDTQVLSGVFCHRWTFILFCLLKRVAVKVEKLWWYGNESTAIPVVLWGRTYALQCSQLNASISMLWCSQWKCWNTNSG